MSGSSPFPPARDLTARELGAAAGRPKAGRFPRPADDSPLADGGAGKEDPSLPLSIGAVPPVGFTTERHM